MWLCPLSSSPALSFAAGGALAQAAGVITTRRLALPSHPVISACQTIAAAGVFLAASLASETMRFDPRPEILLPFFYLVGPGTIAPVICLNLLMRGTTPFVTTSYAFAKPAVALALGHFLIGEPLAPSALVAFALIALGLGFVLRSGGPSLSPARRS